MSKKHTGLLIAFGAVLGAAAAAVSYYLKFKSFTNELNQDFHDYEDDEPDEIEKKAESVSQKEAPRRSYISLWKTKSNANQAASDEEPENVPDEEDAAAENEACDNAEASAVSEEAAEPEENSEAFRSSSKATVEEDMDGVNS